MPTPFYKTQLIIKKLPGTSGVILQLARISLRVLYTGKGISEVRGAESGSFM
jgi:hypothetical protein